MVVEALTVSNGPFCGRLVADPRFSYTPPRFRSGKPKSTGFRDSPVSPSCDATSVS